MLMETGTSLLLSGYTVRHYHPYTGIDLVVETTKDHWPGGNPGGGDTPARDWDDEGAGREPYSRVRFLQSCFWDLVKGAAWADEARSFSSLPGKKGDQIQLSLGSKPHSSLCLPSPSFFPSALSLATLFNFMLIQRRVKGERKAIFASAPQVKNSEGTRSSHWGPCFRA